MENQEKTFDIEKAKAAQKAFVQEKKLPFFPPDNGVCWCCKKNIYSEINGRGITVERASKELVTGCPHCHRSYCD